MEKGGRNAEEERQMLALAMASYVHWTRRPDVTSKEKSIGCWQVSRVFCLLREGTMAQKWAQGCLEYSHDLPAFYLAYAYEALARAELILGDSDSARDHLQKAMALLPSVTDEEEKKLLEQDLKALALPV